MDGGASAVQPHVPVSPSPVTAHLAIQHPDCHVLTVVIGSAVRQAVGRGDAAATASY